MRFLFVVPGLRGDRPRGRAWELGRALARRGHRVMLSTLGKSWSSRLEEREGVEILTLPGLRLGGLELLGPLAMRVLQREAGQRGPYDGIHVFAATEGFARAAARRLCASGKPPALDFELPPGGEAATAERLARAARACLFASPTLLAEARAWGLPADRLILAGNGADTAAAPPERLACRQALGLSPHTPILVCSCLEAGAPGLAVQAHRDLLTAHAGLLLVCLGEPTPGSLPPQGAGGMKSQPGLRILRDPDSKAVRQWLGAADVALVPLEDRPAQRATLPLALGEALAAARATVVSEVGEAARLVRERLCGVLARNQEQFNRRIEELLHNAERRARLEQLARHTAESALSWDSSVDALLSLYQATEKKTHAKGK